jgi:peptidoglycan hydrolase CwlO-like protein
MKKNYFTLAVIMLIAGSVFTGCDNRDSAKEDVEKANQEMIDAQTKFEKEWQQFKSDVELKIDANQKQIDNLKAAMKETTARFKAKYENQLLTLEQKNIELRKKLNDYKYEGKDNWEIFKVEFNQKVDTVITAINDIFSEKD